MTERRPFGKEVFDPEEDQRKDLNRLVKNSK